MRRKGRSSRGLGFRGLLFALLPAVAFLAAVAQLPALAQQGVLPNLTLEQIQALQQAQQAQSAQRQAGDPAQPPPDMVLRPDQAAQLQLQQIQPPSRLERLLSRRVSPSPSLTQFGYDQLGSARSIIVPQTGAVQDDYVLGVGDELAVSLRGQEILNPDVRAVVDRNGQVILPRLSPIPAAGRTLASFRSDVQAAVSRAYVATNAFVSVGRVRQISVLVSGEVNNPGLRLVTGLNSVVDALLLSGGVKKTGTLRNIRVQRGSREFVIDLYSVLTTGGGATPMRLADGDRISVPLLGPVAAVTGLVRRPAIYELPSGQSAITVRALVALAGGEEVQGLFRLSVLRAEADGTSSQVVVRDDTAQVRNSEILFVQLAADQLANRARLVGESRLSGVFPVAQATMLSDMIKAPGTLPANPYSLLGIISRRDPLTQMPTLVAFTPAAVLRGSENMALQTDDVVWVISAEENRMLMVVLQEFLARQEAERQAIRNPVANANVTAPSTGSSTGNGALSGAIQGGAASDQNSLRTERNTVQGLGNQTQAIPAPARIYTDAAGALTTVSPPTQAAPGAGNVPLRAGPGLPATQETVELGYGASRETASFNQLAQQLNVDPLVLTRFLLDHRATLTGAVRGPGTYLVGPHVTLQDLLTAAGGASNWTDASSVELITTAVDPASGRSQTHLNRLPLNGSLLTNYIIQPHDEFRFNEVFNDANLGSVTVQGEVRFAGTYKLTRGERLSDLLSRAGGLTAAAYPYGTVFLRKSAALREREAYARAANEAQDQLILAMTRTGTSRLDPMAFSSMQGLITDLRNQRALGRVSIQADPSVLAANPTLDPLLEEGDVLYIPPRPSTISVFGQVMQAGSYPYRPGATVEDYVDMAGGVARFANDSDTFVIFPDGSARKIEKAWLRFGASTNLPPGSTIVVPRDIAPLDLRQTIIDLTQILSQLAVSAASLALLSR